MVSGTRGLYGHQQTANVLKTKIATFTSSRIWKLEIRNNSELAEANKEEKVKQKKF